MKKKTKNAIIWETKNAIDFLGLSFGGDVDDLLNNMLTTLLKLKQSLANEQNGNANMEEIHECCDSAGQCRDIQKGELCNGIVKSVSEMHCKIQIITLKNVIFYT